MIYLHYKSPTHIYPPNPDDIYLYFNSSKEARCGSSHISCNKCLFNDRINCAPAVTALLTAYPDPTILTPDTHPEIFL